MAHSEEKCKLLDYDHMLIVASWGSPKEYRKAKYALELEVIRDKVGRTTIPPLDKSHHSSIAAIKDMLRKRLGIDKDKLILLIFSQDTILLDYIKRYPKSTSRKKVKSSRGKS